MIKMAKKKGGRPKKYTEAEKMQEKIDKYFDSCYEPIVFLNKDKTKYIAIKDSQGKIIKKQSRPFTVTGLADALGMSRQSLLNYSDEEEFFDTIMRAKRKCELYAEERLFDKDGANGAKFSLSNNFKGWKDKQETLNVNTSYE